MNRYFQGIGRIEHRPEAGPEDSLVFRHYNAKETVHGRTMEDWLRFSVSYFHTFRFFGSENHYGERTLQRPWDDGTRSMDNHRRRLHAAFEFFYKLGVKYYSVSDIDLAPEGDSFDDSHKNLDEIVTMACELQRMTGIQPMDFSADLFSNPKYMNGAATNPDSHVFAYACAQVKRAMDIAKRLNARNFLFFHPRDGYQYNHLHYMFRDMTHIANFYRMAIEYKDKIGYKGQLLIHPKPHDAERHQYQSDVMSTMNLLHYFNLEKHFKFYVKPAFSRIMGRSYEHDVCMAGAFHMLGMVDVSDCYPEKNYTTDIFARDMRDATLVMKCVLQQGGLQDGGFCLGGRVRRESLEPKDLMTGHILAMDTFAKALLNASRMIADGHFAKNLQKRYISYSNGIGDLIEKGLVQFDDCEDYIMQNGEPETESSRHEHFDNMLNYYVFPPNPTHPCPKAIEHPPTMTHV